MILLDETALSDALNAKAKGLEKHHRDQGYHMEYHDFHPSEQSTSSNDYLLDEAALRRALQVKAEQNHAKQPTVPEKVSKLKTLPRRKSRRKSNTRPPPSIQKIDSFHSESSVSSYAASTTYPATITTKSLGSSHQEEEEGEESLTESLTTSYSSRQGRSPIRQGIRSPTITKPSNKKTRHRQPSRRSQSEPRKRISDSEKREQTMAQESSTIYDNDGKRSYFQTRRNPRSVIQPVLASDIMVDANLHADAMGGLKYIEKVASRFFVIAKTIPVISPFLTSLHQVRDEFIALGTMKMTNDMEVLSQLLQFHYLLVHNGIDINRIMSLWVDAYEAIWLSTKDDDSRTIAGPARAVFHLQTLSELYHQHQRDLQWQQQMEDDERRMEEQQRTRQQRREFLKKKRRRRRAKSLDRALICRFRDI
jgi:hypothetical protein